jgi:hypothetical protein
MKRNHLLNFGEQVRIVLELTGQKEWWLPTSKDFIYI